MITRRLRITGRVQGVGYRYALRHEAARRGVTGWVRNRADGSVEALVHGEAHAVEAVIAWARIGPPAAHVLGIAISPAEAEDDRPHAGFDLRPTA